MENVKSKFKYFSSAYSRTLENIVSVTDDDMSYLIQFDPNFQEP